jgi:hypothetical protein
MGPNERRDLLRCTAAASALLALGARARPVPSAAEGSWTAARCSACELRCDVAVAGGAGGPVAVRLGDARRSCARGMLVRRMLAPAGPVIAGALVVTARRAAPSVAARLLATGAAELVGGDGDAMLAAVWRARDGAALEAEAARLVESDRDVVAVQATSVALGG